VPYSPAIWATRLTAMRGRFRGYVLAAMAGAAVGGMVVAVATDALPKLAQRMAGVMADEMKRRGFSPDT
jgi:hypothetical protein